MRMHPFAYTRTFRQRIKTEASPCGGSRDEVIKTQRFRFDLCANGLAIEGRAEGRNEEWLCRSGVWTQNTQT